MCVELPLRSCQSAGMVDQRREEIVGRLPGRFQRAFFAEVVGIVAHQAAVFQVEDFFAQT